MVERSRRGKKKRKLLGNHQRSWLWGRNLVQETLQTGRWPILELQLDADLPQEESSAAIRRADELGVPVKTVARDSLQQLCHTSEHQGYVALMGAFPYESSTELLNSSSDTALYLILDGIQDPFNFGAMLRSADGFGVAGVFIGNQSQVPVTTMVARSSAGSVNRVRIARVPSLVDLVPELRSRGLRITGASEKVKQPLTSCDFRCGSVLVIGNEGHGISPELLEQCDQLACIPLSGALSSLNAAAATGIFCYEARRQQQTPHAP